MQPPNINAQTRKKIPTSNKPVSGVCCVCLRGLGMVGVQVSVSLNKKSKMGRNPDQEAQPPRKIGGQLKPDA